MDYIILTLFHFHCELYPPLPIGMKTDHLNYCFSRTYWGKKLKYPHRKKENLVSTFKRTTTAAATSSVEPWVRDSGGAISCTTCFTPHSASCPFLLLLLVSERRRAVPLSARLLAVAAPFYNFTHAAPILSWPSSANTNFSTSQIEKLPKTSEPANSLANCIIRCDSETSSTLLHALFFFILLWKIIYLINVQQGFFEVFIKSSSLFY